ncbi:MAG: hypothetical protein LBL50_04795 [Candidatus Margulisbacteria bacterium]|jgi:hypothetical protein|nr:hypothetical protein [Candidatus Margulisiibacteriota bacterium]
MASNYTDSFAGDPYFIKKGEQLSAAGMTTALNTKEKVVNKVTTINNQSTDAQYPSAKVVYDTLSGTNNDIVHKASAETITGVKTFGVTGAPAEPLLGVAKTDAVTNSGTNFATEAQVYTVNSVISGKQDILPIGTILMFDGASWKDDNTLPGWYSCDKGNYNKRLTPNLEDKFIKGKGSLTDTGGSNALTDAMLPKHTHSIYTDATKNTSGGDAKSLKGSFGADNGMVASTVYFAGGMLSLEDYSYDTISYDNIGLGKKISIDATHEHTGSTNNDNSATTDANTSNMPEYYSLIYIKRVE